MSSTPEVLSTLLFKVAFTAIASLLSWRIWRFTVRPRLYSNEPRELPYWIPFIGHAGAFFQDFSGATVKGRKHFAPSRQPFSMTVAGEVIYIATSPKDISHVWSNSKTISQIPISREIYSAVGLTQKQQDIMFDTHPNAKYNIGNAKPLTPTQWIIELHHQQLRPGAKLDALFEKIIPALFHDLDFVSHDQPAVLKRTGKSVVVSLKQLIIDAFIKAESKVFFGPKILDISPDIAQIFMGWEDTNWKVLFKLPGFLSRDMLAVKKTLVDSFAAYYKSPRSGRTDASFFVTEFEDLHREIGFDEQAIGKMLLCHYWAIFGNAYKLAFWTMAHLCHDPTLLSQIRQEVLPAVRSQSLDETYLQEKCPKLESLVSETLRLYVTSSLARVMVETAVVGGKTLKKGRKIMLPIRELHYDEQIWGSSPETLQPSRFVENPKMARNLGYRPWGSGHTMCPGRFLARRAVNAFVAILLAKYDVAVVSSAFPEADGARPSPGVVPWAKGEDVEIGLSPRE